jgi:hypothetical protein
VSVGSRPPRRGGRASVERSGGYAASPATGLLGALRILRDRDHQGFHDGIAGTVVRGQPRLLTIHP